MSLLEKTFLAVNTTVIGMGIVFLVLIALSIIIAIQSKLVSMFFKASLTPGQLGESSGEKTPAIDKTGVISGETVIIGIDDEETVAIIMAIVSHHVNIPISQLKFKSIKSI